MSRTYDLRTDSISRHLYANDASMFEELPEGVTFPKNTHDIQEIVRDARRHKQKITARAAGTSLAGQATGGGLIMDTSRYMTDIPEINPAEHYARVQPGVIRDSLNRAVAGHGLFFGPDTSTTSRCMLGGMIGNNSSGSYSIKYGTTREHIIEIEAVLSEGSVTTFRPMRPDELESISRTETFEGRIYRETLRLLKKNRDFILNAWPHPEVKRRNTGYALDILLQMQPFNPNGRLFNMAELLCGSEGTLAMTASAKMNLVPLESEKVLLIPQFNTLHDAMVATVEAVKYNPAAVELIDRIIMDATKGNIEHRKNRFFLESDPECILIIEFMGDDRAELLEKATELAAVLKTKKLGHSHPIFTDPEKIYRVWELRKAGLGLLMGLSSDSKSPTFVEDTAVRVQDLPEYVADFRKILKKHNTNCVFYAHASVGELHLRPVIDLLKPDGAVKMKMMAEEVADLVKKYRGSLSGEHGDGRARSPYIEKVLGKEAIPLLRSVKQLWDPAYVFNPNKIVRPKPIDMDLRFTPDKQIPALNTIFKWRRERGFSEAMKLCNGAGACRKIAASGGTMCPSYMATLEERETTRGRANLFRQYFTSRGEKAFSSEEIKTALDLCLSCKACKTECPANVDMARMKAEFMQGWYEENGTPLSAWFFGEAARLYPLASLTPAIANRVMGSNAGKDVFRRLFNIEPRRNLPTFAAQTYRSWYRKRGVINESGDKVLLFVDPFINYHEPEIGIAATQVLEKLGFRVLVGDHLESGRTQISKGLLKRAKKVAETNIDRLYPYANKKIPIIGLEPSEILTLSDEYLDLCEDDQLGKARTVADMAVSFEDFLDSRLIGDSNGLFFGRNRRVYVHGHCHAKALTGLDGLMSLLRKAGFDPQALKTGCCGMAGSFGYETDKYKTSMDIGELQLFPAVRGMNSDSLLCMHGFSCRHQVSDGTGVKGLHPAVIIRDALGPAPIPALKIIV